VRDVMEKESCSMGKVRIAANSEAAQSGNNCRDSAWHQVRMDSTSREPREFFHRHLPGVTLTGQSRSQSPIS
jgi:hypothetical protein